MSHETFKKYTPEEFEAFIREDPTAAVEWLKDEIEGIENPDLHTAARAMFLLVLVSQSLRVVITLDDPESVSMRLARLSILIDERILELFSDWLGEDPETD